MSALRCAHLGQVVLGNSCYFANVSKIGQDSAGTLCLLSALSLCSRCIVLEYTLISHFKGVFRGFPLLDVGYIASMLCVACGAFVCVRCLAVLWLEACLPPFFLFFLFFAFLFISLPAFCPSPCLLCSGCLLLVLLSCLSFPALFVVSFSLADVQTKRKGALCWCVLS